MVSRRAHRRKGANHLPDRQPPRALGVAIEIAEEEAEHEESQIAEEDADRGV